MAIKNIYNSIHKKKVLIILTLIAVVVNNEFLDLLQASDSWELMSTLKSSEDSARVLFVSDSQILSTLTEPFFPLSLLFVWDANRFVRRSFNAAVLACKPDAIIFLGDQLNDGSVADDVFFKQLVDEFNKIFVIPPTVNKVVYVAGDNDIGGEGMDYITDHKINRFKRFFSKSGREVYKFIEFISADDKTGESSYRRDNMDLMRILLTHQPIMTGFGNKKVVTHEDPDIIFSGHYHDAYFFSDSLSQAKSFKLTAFSHLNEVYNFTLGPERLTEVVVPTCSYRMGRKHYGFGLAVIDRKGTMHYSVLWLPSRFNQLRLYLQSVLGLTALFLLPKVVSFLWYLVTLYRRVYCSGGFRKNCRSHYHLSKA